MIASNGRELPEDAALEPVQTGERLHEPRRRQRPTALDEGPRDGFEERQLRLRGRRDTGRRGLPDRREVGRVPFGVAEGELLQAVPHRGERSSGDVDGRAGLRVDRQLEGAVPG
jgi:hypothetical protein